MAAEPSARLLACGRRRRSACPGRPPDDREQQIFNELTGDDLVSWRHVWKEWLGTPDVDGPGFIRALQSVGAGAGVPMQVVVTIVSQA